MVDRSPPGPWVPLLYVVFAAYNFGNGFVVDGLVVLGFGCWTALEWLVPTLTEIRVDHALEFAGVVAVLVAIGIASVAIL